MRITRAQIIEYIEKSDQSKTAERIFSLYESGLLENETYDSGTGYLFVFTDVSDVWPFLPTYRVSLHPKSLTIEIDYMELTEARKEKSRELMKALTGQGLADFLKQVKAKAKKKEKEEPKLI